MGDRFREYLIEEEQISDTFRVSKHSPIILRVIEVELVLILREISPQVLLRTVFVELGQMGRYACVQPADDIVEYLLFVAHPLVGVAEAVILIYKFPNVGAVVIGERLDVRMYVEILSLIISLILDVPNPAVFADAALVLPQVEVVEVRLDFLRVGPELGNVLVVAPTNCAALTLADLVHGAQLALLVYVQADYSEVLGLH